MSRVIRSDACESIASAPTTERSPRIVRREVLGARVEAEAIVKEAYRQAHLLETEARERIKNIEVIAAQEARAREEARFFAAFLELEQERQRLVEHARAQGSEVAVLLAERLVRRALKIDPQLIATLAEQTIAQSRGSADVTLLCHPDDGAALRTLLANYPSVRLDVDASLSRGDLRLVTNLGTIDATIRSQLAQLARALNGAL